MILKNGKKRPEMSWLERRIFILKHQLDDLKYLPRQVIEFVQRLIYWLPILWKDRDYDHYHFHKMMLHKIKSIRKHHAEEKRHTCYKKRLKEMDTCIDALERLTSNFNYIEKEEDAHTKKWGDPVMDFIDMDDGTGNYMMDSYRTKARKLGKEEQERKEFMAMWKLEEKRRNKDLDKLYATLRKYVEGWWT